MRFRFFISSVQSEFAEARRALKTFLMSDALLRDYVEDVFLFEDQPADNRTPGEIYLREAAGSGISVILDECRAAGLPKPNFALRDGSFVLTIFRKKSAIGSEKSAIDPKKFAIGGEKLAIDLEKLAIGSEPTRDKVRALFSVFGMDRIFGRSDVSSVIHLPYSNAGYLIMQLRKGNVIIPVVGSGKGKYRFNPQLPTLNI